MYLIMKRISIVLLCVMSASFAYSQNCPGISVQGATMINEGDTAFFFAAIKPLQSSPTYNWVISNGAIFSGQGTAMIKVVTEKMGGQFITATVDIGGLPRECNSSSSATIDVQKGPEKIISADYTTPQALTTAIQKFITDTDLKNINISQTAFIYIYSNAASPSSFKTIESVFIKEFEKNGIFSFQYKIANGGKKKTAAFEIYRLMLGAPEPKPSL